MSRDFTDLAQLVEYAKALRAVGVREVTLTDPGAAQVIHLKLDPPDPHAVREPTGETPVLTEKQQIRQELGLG